MLLATLIADFVKRALEEASDKPDIVDVVPAPFCEECGDHESFEINSINNDQVMCANCGAIRSIKE